MNFFTADQHFCHNNIIKYCSRPFEDTTEMNKVLIERHNLIVSKDDTVYFLGDIGMGNQHKIAECIQQLNGRKILIQGNHDRWSKTKLHDQFGFDEVHRSLTLFNPDFLIGTPWNMVVMAHDPVNSLFIAREYSGNEVLILNGHIHDLDYQTVDEGCINRYSINVGVDVFEYYPMSINDIRVRDDYIYEELHRPPRRINEKEHTS